MPIDIYLGGVLLGGGDLVVADVPVVVDATVRSRKTATLSIRSKANLSSPATGTEVKIHSHGGAQEFGGFIDNADQSYDHIGQRNHGLQCRDYSSLADLRSTGDRSYVNVKLYDIFRDLVTNCLSTDGVSLALIPANTGPVIAKLELDYATVAGGFDAACRAAVGYEWEINSNKEARIYQPAIGASLATINNTTVGIMDGSVKGKASLEGYANKVVVVLSRVLTAPQTETFTNLHATQPTNGVRRDWEMAYPLESVPTVKVNGTAQVVWLDNAGVTQPWYWQPGSAVVRQDVGSAVLLATDTLEVVYVGQQTQTVFAQDAAEIAVRAAIETRSGVYEKIVRSSAPIALANSQAFANALLAEMKVVPYEIEFVAKGTGYAPGQKYTLGFTGHPTGDYIVMRTQWLTVDRSWSTAASSPEERTRVYLSKGALVRDLYESWKEALGTGSAGVSVSGSTVANAGAATPAENVATVAAVVTYDAARWGLNLTVTFGASRTYIAKAIVIARGPTNVGVSIDRVLYEFVPPSAGNYTATLGPDWLRAGVAHNFVILVQTYNAIGDPTEFPISSSTITVNPVDNTTQATLTSATAWYETTADGLGVFGFTVGFTQANDTDTSHTEIWLESYDSGAAAYRKEQLYTQTGPGGGDNGFAISGKGSLVDATPTAAQNIRLTFYTVTKAGNRKSTPSQIVVSVSAQTGALKMHRADPATLGAGLAVSAGLLRVPVGGIGTTLLAALAVTAAELADSAVTATKIANLAVGNAAIANLAVDNAKINDLSLSKLTTGTMSVGGGGATFSGTGGIAITGNGSVTVATGGVSANNIYALASSYGWSMIGGTIPTLDYTALFAGGFINAPSFRVGGTEVVSSARHASFADLKYTGLFKILHGTTGATSPPATFTKFFYVYDGAGTLLGYVPIY